jgi:hypothetical protein
LELEEVESNKTKMQLTHVGFTGRKMKIICLDLKFGRIKDSV